MPNLFARQTSLTDVKGRLDYIGNPLRQEHLLATYDSASHLLGGQYWEKLAEESQTAFEQFGVKTRIIKTKSGKEVEQKLHCCEAKEVFFLIGNELLDRKSADEILKTACTVVSQKINRPVTGALHVNKSNSSLHIHIIYSDRQLLPNQCTKVAERNLFFDSCGKRRYKKTEITDEKGELLPGCRIIKKGELYENHFFGPVDKKMVDKKWLKDFKSNCILPLRNNELKGDVEITEYDPSTGMLPQQYIGNRAPADVATKLTQYNAMVREYNAAIKLGYVTLEQALFVQGEVMSSEYKNDVLDGYLRQLRKRRNDHILIPVRSPDLSSIINSAKYRLPTSYYWEQYNAIRDETWKQFLIGQRNAVNALQRTKNARENLFLKNCYIVWDRKQKKYTRKMFKPDELEKNDYFEQKEEIDYQIKQHKSSIEYMRKYQEVAKGRQEIVQAMLLAGAEREQIDIALRNYADAMSLLRYYANVPDADIEHRRLKVAQESLARARVRADTYLKKLNSSQMAKESALEMQTQQEYEAYKAGNKSQEFPAIVSHSEKLDEHTIQKQPNIYLKKADIMR